MLVVADRVGADVTVHGPDGERSFSEDGADHHIRKVASGGWSQKRFQDTAEDLWKKNARRVAERVDREVERVGARLVLAAGDAAALTALEATLGTRSLDLLLRVPEGSRAEGSADDLLDDRVATSVAAVAAADVLAVVDRYRTRQGAADGADGRAVDGLGATLAALRAGQVETLLLVDDPSSDAVLWTAADPTLAATARDELAGLGAGELLEERADAVLVRAAVATGADLTVVPGAELALADGVGALLRWAGRSDAQEG